MAAWDSMSNGSFANNATFEQSSTDTLSRDDGELSSRSVSPPAAVLSQSVGTLEEVTLFSRQQSRALDEIVQLRGGRSATESQSSQGTHALGFGRNLI